MKNLGLVSIFSGIFFSGGLSAAEFNLVPTGTELDLIIVSGEFTSGDALRFETMTRNIGNAGVLFESRGGLVIEAMQIGRTISERGYSTGVPPNSVCASACALAWLAGADRYMATSSLIGFHAAYVVNSDGRVSESGAANALVGAYLNGLGLLDEAIVFATIAGPNDIVWLTVEDALRTGIRVRLLDLGQDILDIPGPDGPKSLSSAHPELQQGPPIQLALPSGRRWVVLESTIRLEDLKLSSQADHVVQTRNGYFASVLGPYDESDARIILEQPFVPPDAYLSSGTGFVSQIR